MSNIICLPSYREGFGSVVIEAAAVGLPSIVSNIYGLSDSIIKNKTGLTHKPGDVKALSNLMVYASANQKLMTTFGKAAQKRARIEFDSKILVNHWKYFYSQYLT